jgi:hypothetical protein
MPFSPKEFIVQKPEYSKQNKTLTLTCKRPAKLEAGPIDCLVKATLYRHKADRRKAKFALAITDQDATEPGASPPRKSMKLQFHGVETSFLYRIKVQFFCSYNSDFELYPFEVTRESYYPSLTSGGGGGGGGFIPPSLTIDTVEPDGNLAPPYEVGISSDAPYISATLNCIGGLPMIATVTSVGRNKFKLAFAAPMAGSTCVLCVTATNAAGESTTVCITVHIV